MSARQSSAVDHALKLITQGDTAYQAAKSVGVALTTVYRALDRHPDTKAIAQKQRALRARSKAK
jgi:phage tail sheath protein FI